MGTKKAKTRTLKKPAPEGADKAGLYHPAAREISRLLPVGRNHRIERGLVVAR